MTEARGSALSRWRYGFHPQADEMRIHSLERVYLKLGEALRLEMTSERDDLVHLQYYIATELGPWAIWLSSAREDVADAETSLRELAPPFSDDWPPNPGPGDIHQRLTVEAQARTFAAPDLKREIRVPRSD